MQHAHGGHKWARAVTFSVGFAGSSEAEWRQGALAVNGDAPTCYRRREMHLYSETLNRSVTVIFDA